ncbi:MAG: hypothetical protein MJA83_10305 [Gammaproteobacteria bacterium]|nr:hypothetical protein [Gammaproteobacteria bacterium]
MKFSVGEIAILTSGRHDRTCAYIGQECEIFEIGPYSPGYKFINGGCTPNGSDYLVLFKDGLLGAVREFQLKKKPPKEYPLGADICNDICRKTPIREEA